MEGIKISENDLSNINEGENVIIEFVGKYFCDFVWNRFRKLRDLRLELNQMIIKWEKDGIPDDLKCTCYIFSHTCRNG